MPLDGMVCFICASVFCFSPSECGSCLGTLGALTSRTDYGQVETALMSNALLHCSQGRPWGGSQPPGEGQWWLRKKAGLSWDRQMSAAYCQWFSTQWEHGLLITFPSDAKGWIQEWSREGNQQIYFWLVEELAHLYWTEYLVCAPFALPSASSGPELLSYYEPALISSGCLFFWPLPSATKLESPCYFLWAVGTLEERINTLQ